MPNFDEKIAQVTGAGSEFERCMDESNSLPGAKVLVTDINNIPDRIELNREDVHIWWASLDQPRESLPKMVMVLSDDEKVRAERFHFEHHRLRYIAGRACLRQLLGSYLKLHPAQIEFDYNPLGKPMLKNTFNGQVLQFNLSNSEDRVLIAFTLGRLIGIDLEFIHPVPDKDNIARQFFCELECELLLSLSGETKNKTFFELWTCKESLLKAMGTGLTAPINEVEVALNNGNARLVSIATDPRPAADWQFRLFQPAPGYQAALAVKVWAGNPLFIMLPENWPEYKNSILDSPPIHQNIMNQIIPTAEPFFFPASTEVGILLVHGFTGAPKEMRWMGEYLHQQGFTVLGVRLSGHATCPEDMIRSSYTDWLASVEDGYHLLSGVAKTIYMMGLSMGGVLTLTTAAYLPPNSTGTSPVKGLVTMSTPYSLPPDPRLRHIEWISKAVPFMPKGDEEPGSGWFDKEAWKDHVSYPKNPLHAIGELNKLLSVMHTALPQIQVPVLLIHSKDDHYVVKDSMPQIYDHLGTLDKQMLWIEGSGHVITRDTQRQAVFKAAADFVCRVEAQIP